MSAPSPEPRRVATPRWLDLRLVLGVVLVLASVLLGAVVVSRASDTRETVVAKHDLAAGTVLRAADLTVRQVQLPESGERAYVRATDDAVGKTLTRPVARDELLPSAAVRTIRSGTRVTVPFAAGNAPELRVGQRIEVWVSSPRCASVILLPDVTVQSVRSGSGSFGSGNGGQNVVVTVRPDQAARVIGALGIEDAEIRAGVLVGTAGSTTAPPAQADEPSSPGALPGDLADCAEEPASR